MIGELFYRIGEVLGTLEAHLPGAAGGAEPGYGGDPGDGIPSDRSVAVDAAISAAAAWMAARLLRPKPVRWWRVVAAGVSGALLADAVGRLQDDAPGERLSYAEDPRELLGRLAAGVGVAAGYASLVYPRIPGSPLARGLAFGALEIAAAPRGGLVRLAAETPGIRFPLQALALPVDEDAGPAAHMAFGLALGLLYRNGGHEDDDGDPYDYEDDE